MDTDPVLGTRKRANEETPYTPSKRRNQPPHVIYDYPLSENSTNTHHILVGPHTVATEDMDSEQREIHEEEERRTQEVLMTLLRRELSGAIYESPSLSNTVCPDYGRTDAVLELLKDQKWITVVETKIGIKDWPKPNSLERTYYSPFQQLINAIIFAFKHLFPDEAAYWTTRNMEFHVYDKEMQEKADLAAPVKPDLLGVLDSVGPFIQRPCSWLEGEMPGEVKQDWKLLIAQAASYARCVFAAYENRNHVPILCLQHTTAHFRLAVFHRGGLVVSQAMNLATLEGFKSFVATIVGMCSWPTAEDAGYEPGQSHSHFRFNGQIYRIEQALCRRNIVRGSATHVWLLVKEPDNIPRKPARVEPLNTVPPPPPPPQQSSQPQSDVPAESSKFRLRNLEPLSRPVPVAPSDNITLSVDPLPDQLVLKCSHSVSSRCKEEEIFAPVKQYIGIVDIICGYDAGCVSLPDDAIPWDTFERMGSTNLGIEHRVHRHVLIRTLGQPLSSARGPKELGFAILHAVIGHCALFTEGNYLHRDVSSGNILILLNEEQRAVPPLLQGIVTDNTCRAVILDGDAAKKWGDTMAPASHRIGTKPFVSNHVGNAWTVGRSVTHTPLDDLESFQWVLLFTILSLIPPSDRTREESICFRGFISDDLSQVMWERSFLFQGWEANLEEELELSDHLQIFHGLLTDWRAQTLLNKSQRPNMKKDGLDAVKSFSEQAYMNFVRTGLKHIPLLPDTWPSS